MKPEIQLHSRGGIDNRLVRVGGEDSTKYKLKTPLSYRAGFTDDGGYTFIDPSGGPFMTVGTEIDGYKIKGIYEGAIIEFES